MMVNLNNAGNNARSFNMSKLFENNNPFGTPMMPERFNAHRTFFTNKKVLERIEQIKQRIGEALKESVFTEIPEELLEEALLEDIALYDVTLHDYSV